MSVLLTGASGFIGTAVVSRLIEDNRRVIRAVVRGKYNFQQGIEPILFSGIAPDTDWQEMLTNIECVIHLAARVHVMRDEADDPLTEFRKVNTAGTLNLSRQAAENGVRRFIYLSSIKVNGENNTVPFSENDEPAPADPYAISKFEAEQGLFEIAEQTGMEVVVIRPPLVYGPGVKANFLKMMEWLYRGMPLPLGAINNRRSLLAIDNLVDFIVTCIHHPAAANQVFLVADGEDLSTTDLLKRLGRALGKPARLLPVPEKLLNACLKMVGRRELAIRLCGSLQIDIAKAKELLGWYPPVSVDEGLKRTAEWFLKIKKREKGE